MNSVISFLGKMLPIFLIFLFASLDASLAKPVIASSYAQHCGSIAPESSPTKLLLGASSSFLISNGFFSAGSRINNYLALSTTTNNNSIHDSQSPGIFHFQPGQVHRTRDDGTLQLEGTLVLVGARVPWNYNETVVWTRKFDKRRRVVFKLSGFWSETKGKLCMVGTGEIEPSQQHQMASPLSVVLKLEFPKVSTITTSIIEGSIESLESDNKPTYFEPIYLLAYAQRSYNYTMAEQAEESCTRLSQEEAVASDSTSICSNLVKIMQYELFTSSDLIDFLGVRFLSASQFVCSGDGKVRLSMTLSNKITYISSDGKPLLPGKSLVAEGVWDHNNNKLCLVACRVIGKENNSSAVGDCSLGLTFWFPTSFSLKQRSTMVGRMWNMTDNSKNDLNKIVSVYSTDIFSSTEVPGLKYEYTELGRAKKYCEIKKFDPKMTRRFPDAQSYMDMRFHLSVRGTKGRPTWGTVQQISTGETYHGNQYGGLHNGDSMYTTRGTRRTTIPSSPSLVDQNRTTLNVGYTISYNTYTDDVEISAEGIYYSTIGTLCLVGCRKPNFRSTQNGEILNSSARIDDRNLDCEFFIQLQLPPLDSTNEQGKGMITSTRDKLDPLFFEPLKVTFSLMYIIRSVQEFDRMNAEIIMVIFSLTLLCACTYVQLCHARKNSTIRPLMSITMLVVLTLGCMVSLILNTEAMLVPARNRHGLIFLESGGWIDTTNTIARLITLITLLINFRLLQLAWGSRSKKESTGAISRSAEKKSLMFCVPLYIAGALIAWFVHLYFTKLHPSIFTDRRTILNELARYVGLLVDNFLFPQIIFSVLSQSKEKVLNPFFYFGATVVRAAPHVYNAYRAWWYPVNFYNSSYIYANHGEDYYSTIFDVIIPFGGLLFALLVYLQQRFGGRCFLPKRFKQGAGYELVCVSNI